MKKGDKLWKTLNKHVYTLILEVIFISEAELSIKQFIKEKEFMLIFSKNNQFLWLTTHFFT